MVKNNAIKAKNADNSNAYGKSDKDKIVNACLKHAVFDGFNDESLKLACDDCNIDYANGNALFPNPEKDIQAHWAMMLDETTAKKAKTLKKDMRIRDKISTLVKHRINELSKHKVCVKKVLAKAVLPHNSPTFTHQLWDSASVMWLGIGDTTPINDTNYYSKRLILSGVLGSSIMFWANDGENEIDKFVDRRIDDALKLGKLKNIDSLKQFTSFLQFNNHPLKMRD